MMNGSWFRPIIFQYPPPIPPQPPPRPPPPGPPPQRGICPQCGAPLVYNDATGRYICANRNCPSFRPPPGGGRRERVQFCQLCNAPMRDGKCMNQKCVLFDEYDEDQSRQIVRHYKKGWRKWREMGSFFAGDFGEAANKKFQDWSTSVPGRMMRGAQIPARRGLNVAWQAGQDIGAYGVRRAWGLGGKAGKWGKEKVWPRVKNKGKAVFGQFFPKQGLPSRTGAAFGAILATFIGVLIAAYSGNIWFFIGFLSIGVMFVCPSGEEASNEPWGFFGWRKGSAHGFAVLRSLAKVTAVVCFIIGFYQLGSTMTVPLMITIFVGYFAMSSEFDATNPAQIVEATMRFAMGFL
ncbi:MAG: hypothetical protein JSW28_04900, partial [Thermoplasmata archaeon]